MFLIRQSLQYFYTHTCETIITNRQYWMVGSVSFFFFFAWHVGMSKQAPKKTENAVIGTTDNIDNKLM